ncbi:MAG: hypothetical protein JJE50_01630 [Actinomycetales bacterium]|nr:hypothetical protein [Actinomycetales bacterium]
MTTDPLHLALNPSLPEDTADYGGPGDPETARGPDETYCLNCHRLALEHLPGRWSVYGACPEPSVRDRAAEVLAGHLFRTSGSQDAYLGVCSHRNVPYDGELLCSFETHIAHQADALAAAGLLASVGYANLLAEVADDDIECAGCDREGPAAFWDDDDHPWCATCHDAHYAALWAERDALRAEVERLRGVERGWQHDRSEWEGERDAARAERDEHAQARSDLTVVLRDAFAEVERLRAGREVEQQMLRNALPALAERDALAATVARVKALAEDLIGAPGSRRWGYRQETTVRTIQADLHAALNPEKGTP